MPGPVLVLDAIRQRARRGHRTEIGTLRVDLDDSQRSQVARLLGTRWDVSGRAVRLQDLAAALADHGFTVRRFIETLDGRELTDERRERAIRRDAAQAEIADVTGQLVRAGIDANRVTAWLAETRLPRGGTGELADFADRVLRTWHALPAPGTDTRLAQLAATVFDNAHALDYREDLGRAVARLIAHVHDLPRASRPGRDWRAAWAAAGVRCDGVSSRVLTLNLPLRGDITAARWSGPTGEPLWLTLRSLTGPWSAAPRTRVFVCENVTVVEAAADRYGRDCPPMVCTDGQASLAAIDLVSGLALAGCPIAVRADIDEAGFTIVENLRVAAPAATLWRYDARTYSRYVGSEVAVEPREDPDVELERLRELYLQHRVVVHEEALLAHLIGDLEPSPAL
ncbi:DUF2399 domain-containing protein [Nocardia blacklockiae]|nr:DUF2399 domain-containing protein [Nocardia blacklockiae]